MSGPEFEPAFRAGLIELFVWRRDVRRFDRRPLADDAVGRLLGLASLAPSVGLSEPWRFVLVESPTRRQAVRGCFESCNAKVLDGLDGERASRYARLKLAGLDEAPCQFAAFADHGTRQGSGLGRSTMPATIDHSVVLAIHTIWLAARSEGIGLGWVSILDPACMNRILDVPPDWTFIGYFCLGYPAEDHDSPELERAGWEVRRAAGPAVLVR